MAVTKSSRPVKYPAINGDRRFIYRGTKKLPPRKLIYGNGHFKTTVSKKWSILEDSRLQAPASVIRRWAHYIRPASENTSPAPAQAKPIYILVLSSHISHT
jgi:hypothetical protein